MITAAAVADVRRAEDAAMAGLPAGALMQRAAAGLAAVLAGVLRERAGGVYGARVVLLVGPGSNGGDALWAGARLVRRGAQVTAVLTAAAPHAGGLAGFLAAGGRVLDVSAAAGDVTAAPAVPGTGESGTGKAVTGGSGTGVPGRSGTGRSGAARLGDVADLLAGADVVVDGLLGIGGRPGLRGVAAEVVGEVTPGVPVVGVDLPSGVDPDTGALGGPTVRADLTVTFGVPKRCLLLPPANTLAGDVVVVDIGLDAPAGVSPGGRDGDGVAVGRLEAADVAGRWPVPGPGDDKYSRGVLGVVAGGASYPGAAVLCAGAAVRAGAGMVRFVGPADTSARVTARWPEAVPGRGRAQAWVLGPGVDPTDGDRAADVRAVLAEGVPCVVDAGALEVLASVLAQDGEVPGVLLLTPHAGELARLLAALGVGADGDGPGGPGTTGGAGAAGGPGAGGPSRAQVEAEPLRYATAAARRTGATVLLKGATTLVVSPDGVVRAQPGGPHWLATAGSGDVLAGIAGTLLAAGLDPVDAGALAVLAHGTAGRLASMGHPPATLAAGSPGSTAVSSLDDVTGVGGPISAGAVLDAVPAAVRALLAAGGTVGAVTEGVRSGAPTVRDARSEAVPATGPGFRGVDATAGGVPLRQSRP